jgi:hypothetical protein
MQFPHLRSLTVGFCQLSDVPHEITFIDFLLEHSDTIEELDLEYDGYKDEVFMFDQETWICFEPTFLRHLHSLRGQPLVLENFGYARMDCLKTTLRRLAIGPGEMEDMFDAIEIPQWGIGPAVGTLPAVQEIELELHTLEESDWLAT